MIGERYIFDYDGTGSPLSRALITRYWLCSHSTRCCGADCPHFYDCGIWPEPARICGPQPYPATAYGAAIHSSDPAGLYAGRIRFCLGVISLFQRFLDSIHRDDSFFVPHFRCLRYNRKRKEPRAHRKEASNSCSCKGSLFRNITRVP